MTAIITKRLLLKTHDDPRNLQRMVQWLNDPVVMKYSEQRHLHHNEEFQATHIAVMGEYFREIHHGDDFIGTISAHIDMNNSVADVGILIGEQSQWGKGFGTEAWMGFCNHLLSNGIRKIEAGCMKKNLGMITIFGNYDMFFDGCKVDHFLLDGIAVDAVYYGKFA